MKRYGNLFERICSIENLKAAAHNAARHKTKRKEVRDFLANLDENIATIRRELLTHEYRVSEYTVFEKFEGKRRIIYKLPFKDRVVQWALMLVLEPIWTPTFTNDQYACIKGRGVHLMVRRMQAAMRHDPEGTQYALKLDISKYYPSIKHHIAKMVVRRKIKDPGALWLLDLIIDSAEGVPIGNYISQFIANLSISELCHLLKEWVGLSHVFDYSDDITVLGPDKATLHGVLVFINDYLETERELHLKGNFQIFPVDARGVDMGGYVVFRTHILARKKNKQALCRELAKLRRAGVPEAEIMLLTASRAGFMKHCDSKHLMKTLDMKNFSDLVPQSAGNLTGTKYHIDQILNREIHLTGYKVGPSKFNSDPSLTLQYSIFEQLTEIGPDGQPRPVIDDDGQPVMDWVEHISFTGSQALIRQLGGVEITEPVRAMLIKQQIPGPGKRCFYKFVNAPDQTPKNNEPDSKLQGAKEV